MNKTNNLLGIVILLVSLGICDAQNDSIRERQTLTEGFWGLNNQLADNGIEMGFNVTNIYQAGVRGGVSTHRRAGRYSGSYDLELSADLQKLLGFETGSIYMLVEGGWPDAEGIDAVSVGSAFGVNADAIGNQGPVVKELYYQGLVFSDALTMMVGKIDFTGVFDASAYADDECTQFLNATFVDDPTIPFPDYSLGVILNWDITNSWYLMGGVADAQADARETGFRTTFAGEDYFFYIFETGITPQFVSANGRLPGAYRVGLWYDPQPKANTDLADAGKSYRDDTGFYVTCDQMLAKENAGPDDEQGLGVFFRYGCANGKRNDITDFFSTGFQYAGLVEGRDSDVFGFGFAHGTFSDRASATYTDDYEAAFEMYYSAEIAPWFIVSPSIQYVKNPGGDGSIEDAVVLGARVLMTF